MREEQLSHHYDTLDLKATIALFFVMYTFSPSNAYAHSGFGLIVFIIPPFIVLPASITKILFYLRRNRENSSAVFLFVIIGGAFWELILLYITVFILTDIGLNFVLRIAFIVPWAILFSIFTLPPNYYLFGYEEVMIPGPKRFKLAFSIGFITPVITIIFSHWVANYL